jgi:hypothetical protein
VFFSVLLRRLDIKATARTARSPGTARCSPPVPMRSLRAPLTLRKASPAGPDEATTHQEKEKTPGHWLCDLGFLGAPCRIRTDDLRITSCPVLVRGVRGRPP